MQLKLAILAIIGILVTGCTSSTLKAPCDQYARTCGSKTKINQW